MTLFYRIILLTGLLSLSGCAWLSSTPEDPTANWSASQLHAAGRDAMRSGNYETAVDYFEKLQARYPFGRYAQQAQLDIAYSHYQSGEADEAIAAADRFIRTYPRHPVVDYAYYLRGLANYSRDVGILGRLLPSDPSRTDSQAAQQAFNDFAELVQIFPDSRYAEDAHQRMVFLRNSLAEYEINVARFYLERKSYVAAVNRSRYVLENYQTTPAAENALGIMAEAYHHLALNDLAQDSYRVLERNYPESAYLRRLDAVFRGQPAPPVEENRTMLGRIYNLL